MMSQKVPPNLQHTLCLPCHTWGAAWEAPYEAHQTQLK